MDADHTLDCIGLYCPMPIVKTSQRIKELSGGEVLEVVSDDRGIKSDMPAWCEKTGHEFLGLQEDEGEIKVYVRKNPTTG
ncbi:MAG: sulfurtransferase TusA family protein [Actinobacteria bacterium]|nr:sulfurtransferase TusA family protein [Actinomycetota bacterium]MCG2820197.1 sulfurtransferase TusA family protein [Actinomycetes bacterium]MBU4219831.1 sulfurtransferase TusA family protein [Actinomycetota bacterium]MBU4357725.1 sulfurtransferase TusA family protein [Actinomycetota bacterium]MBU4393273.1 sulfurtransferase TusA family protein [Actinomycetota bacterium]